MKFKKKIKIWIIIGFLLIMGGLMTSSTELRLPDGTIININTIVSTGGNGTSGWNQTGTLLQPADSAVNIRVPSLNAASCDLKADADGDISCGTDSDSGVAASYLNENASYQLGLNKSRGDVIGKDNITFIEGVNVSNATYASGVNWGKIAGIPAGFADNVDDIGALDPSVYNQVNFTFNLNNTNSSMSLLNQSIYGTIVNAYFKDARTKFGIGNISTTANFTQWLVVNNEFNISEDDINTSLPIYYNGNLFNYSITNLNSLPYYVTSVTGASPITSSGGLTPSISINADGFVNDTELQSNISSVKADAFKVSNATANFYSNFGTASANYANNTNPLNLLKNGTDANFQEINITGSSGKNATIWLGNISIQTNGSWWCIPRC